MPSKPASSPGSKPSGQKARGRSGRKKTATWPRRLLTLGLLAGIWGLVGFGALLAYFAYDLPDFNELYIIERRNSISLRAADGSMLATFGDLYGEHRTLAELPKHLPQALLATEDRRFYSHYGIDPVGLARATWHNLRAGRVVQGGSTLTQQLAKNVFLDPSRTLKRKTQELLLAFWLERNFTKDQILEMYLNRVYFGAGAHGVEAAAQRYFDKPADKLSLTESAMLVGLLKAPSRLAPTGNIKSAQARAAQVLENMAAAGYLDDAQAKAALARPAQLARSRLPMLNARYFADWVVEEVYQLVGRDHADLVVWTSLDARLQQAAEHAAEAALARDGDKLNVDQAAMVALSPDGAVRAMVGGREYLESSFNRATQARRQPGSAFKPILFLTALEQGIRPEDQFIDGPISIDSWSPRNFDGKYAGPLSFAEAAARSTNTVAVQLAERVGRQRVIDTARRLGIVSDLKPHPSLALGAFETGLLELTNAYAAFANGGYTVLAYGVLEVRDGRGNILFRRDGQSVMAHMIDPEPLGELNELLQGVVERGTGRAARIGRPAAGKTGTTSDYRDAWFIGYTPDIIAGVWVGNDNNAPMHKVSGGGMPAQIWRAFMQEAVKGSQPRALPERPAPLQPALSGITSLWDRIVSQFGGGQPLPAPAPAVPPPPQTQLPQAGTVPAGTEPQIRWHVGPQPVRQ